MAHATLGVLQWGVLGCAVVRTCRHQCMLRNQQTQAVSVREARPSADWRCAGLDKLRVLQLAGCTNDSLASFRQLQLEGGFCIPTSELQVGPFDALADANCTGLLLYETESQLLHGLWRSTRVEQSEGEVCCSRI